MHAISLHLVLHAFERTLIGVKLLTLETKQDLLRGFWINSGSAKSVPLRVYSIVSAYTPTIVRQQNLLSTPTGSTCMRIALVLHAGGNMNT
jgi:hypothetical protein